MQTHYIPLHSSCGATWSVSDPTHKNAFRVDCLAGLSKHPQVHPSAIKYAPPATVTLFGFKTTSRCSLDAKTINQRYNTLYSNKVKKTLYHLSWSGNSLTQRMKKLITIYFLLLCFLLVLLARNQHSKTAVDLTLINIYYLIILRSILSTTIYCIMSVLL